MSSQIKQPPQSTKQIGLIGDLQSLLPALRERAKLRR
jgi:hypothetical protein